MGMGYKGMRNFMERGKGAIPGTADKIDKESFLEQLKEAWYPYIRKEADIEDEVRKARKRISKSGPFRIAFEKVGITDDDLRSLIKSIQDSKSEQVKGLVKVGRNDPCPCGSGKKYKKCCLGKSET